MSIKKYSERDSKYVSQPGEYWDVEHQILWNMWTTKEILNQCKLFEFRKSDIILATFPKSGTTLVQETLWLIFHNADTEKAKELPVYVRVPFLELAVSPEDTLNPEDHIHLLKRWPENEVRLIKTHLPLRYIAKNLQKIKPKIICVFRHPKDTLVSYYHFYCGNTDYGPWKGTFDEFFQMWMDGHIVAGDWFDVLSEWWTQKEEKNYLFLFYENLIREPKKELIKITEFCNINLTDDLLNKIVEHTKFDNMKANPSTNYSTMPGIEFSFMRKGQSGDWKNYFSSQQNELFNEKMEKYRGKLPEQLFV